MADDFGSLLATLRHEFPASLLEPVAEPKLATIRREYPGVPEHYLAFLRKVGYGSLGDWFMIYGGPVKPNEIFDPDTAAGLEGLVFFGDTFGSTIFGFDTREGWRLVGVDHHTLEIDPEEAVTVGEFLARRLADQ
jgi:hypothetical protein